MIIKFGENLIFDIRKSREEVYAKMIEIYVDPLRSLLFLSSVEDTRRKNTTRFEESSAPPCFER